MKIRSNRFVNLALALTLLTSMLSACGDSAETPSHTGSTSETAPTPEVGQPTAEPSGSDGSTTPAEAGQPGTWLVMLYQNADDAVLEQDIMIDLNEAEIVGSTDQVKVVSQLDRYKGAYAGDGDWTTAKRFLVTQDDNLDKVNSQELADLGEVDSGNPKTLIDFATWAIKAYPADH